MLEAERAKLRKVEERANVRVPRPGQERQEVNCRLGPIIKLQPYAVLAEILSAGDLDAVRDHGKRRLILSVETDF